jgi:hypothetical protein
MTTTNGTITTAGVGQWANVDPNTAVSTMALSNTSSDTLIFAANGSLASPTNGFIVAPGASALFTKGAIDGPRYPTGPLSVWGPSRGQSYSIVIT